MQAGGLVDHAKATGSHSQLGRARNDQGIDAETAVERQSVLNERIISEIDVMSKEALAFLKSNFERELWELHVDDEARASFIATPAADRLDKFKILVRA